MARSSRYASCHFFYHLIIYSRSCRIACLVVLQPYVYRSRQQFIPTEELLDKEEESQRCGGAKEKPLQQLSEERRNFIQNSLDQWCMDLGYKDCNVNMLTLSRTLCISKNELSLFFDQCLHSNFRIWLSEIRLNAAKKMMLEYPDYSNDIISAECGFSCRTHLYRIFKTKEGCSPTEWRDFQSTEAAQNGSN